MILLVKFFWSQSALVSLKRLMTYCPSLKIGKLWFVFGTNAFFQSEFFSSGTSLRGMKDGKYHLEVRLFHILRLSYLTFQHKCCCSPEGTPIITQQGEPVDLSVLPNV